MLNSIQFTQVNSLRELFQAKTLIFNSPSHHYVSRVSFYYYNQPRFWYNFIAVRHLTPLLL